MRRDNWPADWEEYKPEGEYGKQLYKHRRLFERIGYLGKHELFGNVIRLELHRNYNGSGKSPERADDWPVLTLHVAFEVGQEELRDLLAIKIAKLIDETIPLPKEAQDGNEV